MTKLEYTEELVGIKPENAYLSDHVMVGSTRNVNKLLSVPQIKNGRIVGAVKVVADYPYENGAQSFVDEDILIGTNTLSGIDFTPIPIRGGFYLDFGPYGFFTRVAKPFEFSSINAFITFEGSVVYNHLFIQKMFYKDFLASNNVSQWRMPFSPESASNLAISWQMIDSAGGKWECVAPNLQKPNNIVRLKHFNLTDPKAESVNLVYGNAPGYDVDSHSFIITAGCKIRMFFINSPMGQKEWSDEVELDIDTNTIKFI